MRVQHTFVDTTVVAVCAAKWFCACKYYNKSFITVKLLNISIFQLTVVISEMVLQVMFVFRHENAFWTKQQLFWLDVSYMN